MGGGPEGKFGKCFKKAFEKKVFLLKPSEWEYPARVCVFKRKVLKKVLLGAKARRKNVFEKLGTEYTPGLNLHSATTLPLYGKGLSRKFVEAGTGRHNSRGVQVMTPDAGLRSSGGS